MAKPEPTIRLDQNNPVFLEQLLKLQKAELHAALDNRNKIRQLIWTNEGGPSPSCLEIEPD